MSKTHNREKNAGTPCQEDAVGNGVRCAHVRLDKWARALLSVGEESVE
jgi:hypothetical protein